MQSLNLVSPIFNFEMSSLVFKIALEVNRAEIPVAIIPTLGFNNDNVDVVIAEPDPIKNSVN